MAVTKLQTVSGNNGAAATTSVAATLAASTPLTTLIAAVMCGVNAATITPPAGWVQVNNLINTNPAGGTLGLFKFENNPGGITAVTFTITSSLASCVISEYPGLPSNGTNLDITGNAISSNGVSVTIPPMAQQGFGELLIVAIGYINTALLTLSNIPLGLSQDGSAIGTAGASNACVHLLSNLACGFSPVSGTVTLSGTPTDGPSALGVVFKNVNPLQPSNGNVGPNTYSGQ